MDKHPPSSSTSCEGEIGKRPGIDISNLFAKRPPGSKAALFFRGGVQIHMRVSDPEAAMKEVPLFLPTNPNILHAQQDSSPPIGTTFYGSPDFLIRAGSGFAIVQIKNGVISKRRLVQDSSGTGDIPEFFARSIARLKQSSTSAAAAAATTRTKPYGRVRVIPRDGYNASVKQRSFLKRRMVQTDDHSSAADAATAAFERLRLKRLL